MIVQLQASGPTGKVSRIIVRIVELCDVRMTKSPESAVFSRVSSGNGTAFPQVHKR
jgi:hypothetical protein